MGALFGKSSSSSVAKQAPVLKVDPKLVVAITDFKHEYDHKISAPLKAELLAKTKQRAKGILERELKKHPKNKRLPHKKKSIEAQVEGLIDKVVGEGGTDDVAIKHQFDKSKTPGSVEQASLSVLGQTLSNEGLGEETLPFAEEGPSTGTTEIKEWLKTLYTDGAIVTLYLGRFTEEGYDQLNFVKEITSKEELTELGFSDAQAGELLQNIRTKWPIPQARYVDYGEFELFDGDYDYELEQAKRGHSFMPVMPQRGFRGGQLGYGATDATDPTIMVILIAVMVCLCFAFVCILSGVACVGGYAMARFMGAKEGNNDKNQNEYEIV